MNYLKKTMSFVFLLGSALGRPDSSLRADSAHAPKTARALGQQVSQSFFNSPVNDYNGRSLQDEYNFQVPTYGFAFNVNDDYTGNSFGQSENADGKMVQGEYRVLLPDGRTQIVTYKSDKTSGYVAQVKYEGTAVYPKTEVKPTYPQSAGGYQQAPRPGYQPGLASSGFKSPSTSSAGASFSEPKQPKQPVYKLPDQVYKATPIYKGESVY
ncbi:uncharacterized protein LOC143025218 [Oratosquilla oratoria]|uniref:uncharacterized protein LOC143025218 n=1 Tax=Oratosquilla oratoria TaxID=337810 RepID=UPI003F75DEF0